MSAVRSRVAARRAAAELLAHRRRLLELSVDPGLDPEDAMLLRIEPGGGTSAVAELASGRDGLQKRGGEDHRERLLALRSAALAVEGDSDHGATSASLTSGYSIGRLA